MWVAQGERRTAIVMLVGGMGSGVTMLASHAAMVRAGALRDPVAATLILAMGRWEGWPGFG